MATVFENYDAARTAFINPGDCVKAQENFPEVCITTFSESIIEDFAKRIPQKKSRNYTRQTEYCQSMASNMQG